MRSRVLRHGVTIHVGTDTEIAALKAAARRALPPLYSPGEALAQLRREHRLVVEVYPWSHPRARELRAALASADPAQVIAALVRPEKSTAR